MLRLARILALISHTNPNSQKQQKHRSGTRRLPCLRQDRKSSVIAKTTRQLDYLSLLELRTSTLQNAQCSHTSFLHPTRFTRGKKSKNKQTKLHRSRATRRFLFFGAALFVYVAVVSTEKAAQGTLKPHLPKERSVQDPVERQTTQYVFSRSYIVGTMWSGH